MEKRRFGPSGRDVAAVGQGTWMMESDARAAVTALRAGLDLGMGHVDTAQMYGSGRVEEIVGEAIAGRRDEVFLVSKVLPTNASYEGTLRACERSLARLRTDRLDGYLLHWPGSHPLEETFRAFEKLRQDGKVLSYGVSNFDAEEMERAVRIAGAQRLACNQVLYHIEERAIEHGLLPWCEAHDVALVAYSPFGQGKVPTPGSEGAKVLDEIARAHAATARQVALAFLLRSPVAFVIPKASRLEHVRENAGASGLELSLAEVAALDRAFPRGEPRSLPML
jgi:diketogulonate reductase-like aldo/keto reductase